MARMDTREAKCGIRGWNSSMKGTLEIRRQIPTVGALGIGSLGFLYLPLITVLVFSFNKSEDATVWGGFSTHWYSTVVHNSDLLRAAKFSLSLALPTSLLAATLATGLAIGLGIGGNRRMAILQVLVNAPLILPEIVTAVGTLTFFSAVKIPLNFTSLLAAHVVLCVPFAFLPIRSRLRDIDLSIFEAAQDLGADSWRVLRKVTVPLLLPAILAATLLSFIISMDDFLTSMFLSGPNTTTLPLYIFGLLKLGASPEVNVISALLLVIPTFGLILSLMWRKKRGK